MEKYWFQNNQYCNVQNMQKVIVGCWKCDFDKIRLLYSKNKSIIWIYTWTRWTTCWTTRPIPTGCEMSIEPYPDWRFWCMDDLDRHFGNGLVPNRTRTRSAGPEPFLTLPIASQITQDGRPKIVDTPLTLIFRMGQVACHPFFWLLRQPIHQKKTTTYQSQYFAMNSRISQRDHKCTIQTSRTRDWNQSAKPCPENLWVDGYTSGFGPPSVSMSGFWAGQRSNQTVLWSKHRLLAGYLHPVLSVIEQPFRRC